MGRIDIEDILDRYLQGEASPEEIERVEAWLNQVGQPDSEWLRMNDMGRRRWLDALFAEIQNSTGINNGNIVSIRSRKILWRSIAAAAVFAVLFIIYLELPFFRSTLSPLQLTELRVPINQKEQVALSDGSKIWLNSGSALKYPKAFNGKKREVYLSGEGYFDIQHDSRKPFIIHTGKVITTVLGTAFNIKEDSRLHTVVVTVTRGKVSVANGNQSLGIITPNQQISFNTVNRQHFQKNVDAKLAIAWQESDLHFNDITFADAVAQLQQRFNVNISFANEKVKNCRFTGTALKAEKLENILKVICAFNNATFQTQANGSIIFDGPGCDQ